jgi:hypothetical protein
MKLSEQLMRLSDKAKKAEDTTDKAVAAGRADLESKTASARKSAEAHAAAVRDKRREASAEAGREWNEMHQRWNDHVKNVHEKFADRKAEMDLKRAQGKASSAEQYAADAIDFADAAIDEAAYAVLEAELKRMDAEQLAASRPSR